MVIYTPNLAMPGYPDDRLIAVDLDRQVTRVFNSDYFGESKKGGLRMWNKLVYERGGLALHAGCKVIPTARGDRVGLIVGLSGTGKTTTTFTRQNGSLPVQDDFVAWWPDGTRLGDRGRLLRQDVRAQPDGRADHPRRGHATPAPTSRTCSMSDDGEVDFYDENYTKNGRAVFSFSDIEAADATDLDAGDFLLVLNRNENVIPAVAKLEGPQAAAFFMLGETTGTVGRRQGRGGQVPARPRHEPVLPDEPRPPGQPLPRAPGARTRSRSTC